MPKYWFDHIHLTSPDPLKTAEFYEKMFNAKRISAQQMAEGRYSVKLDLNGTTILIAPLRGGNQKSGLDHFGIRTDDLETAVRELKGRGVEFTQDIKEIRPDFHISFLLATEDVSIELQEGSL